MVLNFYGCLTSSSLRKVKHEEECKEICRFKFPIVYSHGYNQSLLLLEKMLGIDNLLSYYVHRLLLEEEIIDSKDEEDEWFEDEAEKIRRDDKRRKERENEENGNNETERRSKTDPDAELTSTRKLSRAGSITDAGEMYSPFGKKNFYHEPESPSRAFLFDFMSMWYLLRLCYSLFLTIYLDVPALLFPAWFIRWRVLIPQAKVAKGTVDGVCLAMSYGWAINLDGGFTHARRDSGDMFNVYPDISLAIHYAKKWHVNKARRILVINTS